MRVRTRKATYNVVVGTTPVEVLGPNPFRRAFMLAPVAGLTTATAPFVAVPFAAGLSQSWTVPAGVTQLLDGYVWGSGGNGGSNGGGMGGGGGGGGAFASSGPLSLTPGTTMLVSVDAGGNIQGSTITTAGGVIVANATSGVTAMADASGAGGTASAGAQQRTGGAGAAGTTLAGNAGGGGGAAGFGAVGGTPAGTPGGAGGGVATLGGYGVGGAGGAGGLVSSDGHPGVSPGGGGGGEGDAATAVGPGADGAAVLFYAPSSAASAISLSPRADVQVGAGTWNWLPGFPFLGMLCDYEVGDVIGEPWYLVSGVAGVIVQVTEFSYEPDEPFRAF